MNILLVGRAAENAATALLVHNSKSSVKNILCWPASLESDYLCRDLDAAPNASVAQIVKAAAMAQVDLVILTTECAILSGIANALQSSRIQCFGPTRVASHFRWDSGHESQVIKSIKVSHLGGSVNSESPEGVRGKFVAMVSAGKVHGVGISSALDSHAVTEIAAKLVREIRSEDSPYCGWLVMDLLQTNTGVYYAGVRCMPPVEYISSLAQKADFDFLRAITKLMKTESRALKHCVQQTLAPCLVPA